MKKNTCSLSKSCNVNITNNFEKFVVSEFTSINMQKSLFEICIVDESSSVLKQMSCNLSEINATIVNINDIESKNEILASEFRK